MPQEMGRFGGLLQGLSEGLKTYKEERRYQDELASRKARDEMDRERFQFEKDRMKQELEDRKQKLLMDQDRFSLEQESKGLRKDPEGNWVESPIALAKEKRISQARANEEEQSYQRELQKLEAKQKYDIEERLAGEGYALKDPRLGTRGGLVKLQGFEKKPNQLEQLVQTMTVKQKMEEGQKQREAAIPGLKLKEGFLPDSTTKRDIINKQTASRSLQDSLKELSDLVSKAKGAKVLPGNLKDRMNEVYSDVKIKAKEAANLGALTGPDLGIIEAIPDPTSYWNILKSDEDLTKVYKQAADRAQKNFETAAEASGYEAVEKPSKIVLPSEKKGMVRKRIVKESPFNSLSDDELMRRYKEAGGA